MYPRFRAIFNRNQQVNTHICLKFLTICIYKIFGIRALALNCNAIINDQVGAEAKDWKAGKPIRIVRFYKKGEQSAYSPKNGFRYDGIYKVVKYYREQSKSGFVIWKYLLKRDDPEPAPWIQDGHKLDIMVST